MHPHPSTSYTPPAYPLLADLMPPWVWENQGGATIAQGDKGVTMTIDASAGINMRQILLAVPSLSYQLTVRFGYDGDALANRFAFIGWKAATGAAAAMQLLIFDRRSYYRNYRFDMTNQTTLGAFATYPTTCNGMQWLRIKETAGSIYLYVSSGGDYWRQLYTTTKAAGYLGAGGYNYLVMGGGEDTNAVSYQLSILEYLLENV